MPKPDVNQDAERPHAEVVDNPEDIEPSSEEQERIFDAAAKGEPMPKPEKAEPAPAKKPEPKAEAETKEAKPDDKKPDDSKKDAEPDALEIARKYAEDVAKETPSDEGPGNAEPDKGTSKPEEAQAWQREKAEYERRIAELEGAKAKPAEPEVKAPSFASAKELLAKMPDGPAKKAFEEFASDYPQQAEGVTAALSHALSLLPKPAAPAAGAAGAADGKVAELEKTVREATGALEALARQVAFWDQVTYGFSVGDRRVSGHANARELAASAGYKEWVKTLPQALQALGNVWDPEGASHLLSAYKQHLAQQAKTKAAEEHKKKVDLHKDTLRGGQEGLAGAEPTDDELQEAFNKGAADVEKERSGK